VNGNRRAAAAAGRTGDARHGGSSLRCCVSNSRVGRCCARSTGAAEAAAARMRVATCPAAPGAR